MPRLTWKDGETHEFVVIGKVANKRHWNQKQKTYVPCTGSKSCWYCQHGMDYKGVVIGIACYSPEEIEDTHFPWVSFTANAYRAIRQVLGVTKAWYGHRVQLTRKGESFDTTYSAVDVGVVEESKLSRWNEQRVEELAFDAGEEWGEEEPGERKVPDEEVVMERTRDEEEDLEGKKIYLQELIASAQTELEGLEGED